VLCEYHKYYVTTAPAAAAAAAAVRINAAIGMQWERRESSAPDRTNDLAGGAVSIGLDTD